MILGDIIRNELEQNISIFIVKTQKSCRIIILWRYLMKSNLELLLTVEQNGQNPRPQWNEMGKIRDIGQNL